MKQIIISIISLFLMVSCVFDPATPELIIHNYSDSAIYAYVTCADSISVNKKLKLFEITSNFNEVTKEKQIEFFSPNYRINAYSYGSVSGLSGSSKKPIVNCNNETIKLFLIKENTMKTKTWQEICKNQLYEKKVVLTEEELSKNGWKYTYIADSI